MLDESPPNAIPILVKFEYLQEKKRKTVTY